MSELWTTIESRTEYRCPWFTAGYDLTETPDGDRERYYWIDRPQNAVGIVAADGDEVVMVETYRPKLRDSFWECPGGHLADGESFAEAARRELEEETGIIADTIEIPFRYHPTGIERYERAVVFATDLRIPANRPTDDEVQQWEFVSAERALRRAQTSPSTGWTITPLLAAKANGFLQDV